MKVVYWVVGILIGVPLLFTILMYGASEVGGEVITLHRANADGSTSNVRLWIVDDEGNTWIEHGAWDSHWISQLPESSTVEMTRNGQRASYIGTADSESHALYHELRREKYSWADQLVGMFGAGDGEDCGGLPVRLERVD